MRGASTRVLTLPKATQLVYSLLISSLVISMIPLAVHADEPSDLEKPPGLVGYVESPGSPTGTSEAESYDIVWTWVAPAGGLTPDSVPPENPDEPPPEQPTDIVAYGYELSNQNGIVELDSVGSGVLSLTTTVSEDSTYTLNIWSITREGAVSERVSGSIAFVAPVTQIPVLPPLEAPEPIDTTPVTDNPVANGNRIGGSTPIINENTPGYVTGNASNAPTTFDESGQAVAGVDTAAVVKPSKQGWLILGMAWYVWLIILITGYFIGRQVLLTIRAR